MKRKFCTALCLILALLFFNGCGFINFSFETTEPQTTETEITTKITDDFDFAVEDVPQNCLQTLSEYGNSNMKRCRHLIV